MRIAARLAVIALILMAMSDGEAQAGVRLLPPETGVYHSAHPYFGMFDDLVDGESIAEFERMAEKKIVWSYVSFNWFEGIKFPVESCRAIRERGVVPLVGIMPWSSPNQGRAEPVYTLDRILKGDFDDDLRMCAEDVVSLGFPIMIEFGPEVNGSWFPWNGAWNGRALDSYGERGVPDGPERFRGAYRRVVDIFRKTGALDVTWFFHISSSGAPNEAWNAASNYYPGDEWVDWVGVSLYGRLRGDGPPMPFDAIMKRVYPGLCSLSAVKPIAILEMGTSEGGGLGDKALWITDAMKSINSGRYPRLRAVSWWNKKFRPDGSRSTLEIDSSRESLDAYKEGARGLVDAVRWEGVT
ncbi:MAG: beta-mannanase [Synergistaceae bacterium]|jgi:hypothetical protein|nr:beta-mannanase [Synergistaceae bacterium]